MRKRCTVKLVCFLIAIIFISSILFFREFGPLITGNSHDIFIETITCEISGTSGGGCFALFTKTG
jgi:hypothetical protein